MGYEDSSKIDILRVANFLGFEPIKVSNKIYRDKIHDSLTFFVETNSFAWYSQVGQDTKGSSFNLVKLVTNCTFPEAKKFLIENGLYENEYTNNDKYIKNKDKYINTSFNKNSRDTVSLKKEDEKIGKIEVPPFNKDIRKMLEYFKNIRGIEESTIWKLIKRKQIFFDKLENICFIAKNKDGEWKNITKRRIDSKDFFACKGGDKNYPFCINNDAKDFLVVEGEIDAISCYELYGKKFNYLSTPATTLKGILHYIDEFDVKNCKINLLLDNDEAGIEATKKFLEILKEHTKGKNIILEDVREKVLPQNIKDMNDFLKLKKGIFVKESEKTLNENFRDTVSQENKKYKNIQNIQSTQNYLKKEELKKTKKVEKIKNRKLMFM